MELSEMDIAANTSNAIGLLHSNSQEDVENPDEEDSFIWQDYLDVTNSVEVPDILFSHVEESLLNGLEEGMIMEVPLNNQNKFWLASVVMACGPLLRLRYIGQPEDRSREFWCDLTKIEVHPVGWCKENEIELTVPDELADRLLLSDFKSVLDKVVQESKHAPVELLNGVGLTPVDRIKQGMKLEVQDKFHPHQLETATITRNIGGRLLLQYDQNVSPPSDIWVFYNSTRLFRMGWAAKKGEPWSMLLSDCSASNTLDADMEVTSDQDPIDAPCPTPDIFQSQSVNMPHDFQVGMKLETLHPGNRRDFHPASVVKVFDSYHFLVQIDSFPQAADSFDKESSWLCTKQHPYIFPVGWAQEHDLNLVSPRGWDYDFCWSDYLSACNSIGAPRSCFYQQTSARKMGFRFGMKLEAVNPENAHQICAATISKTIGHLLWIFLECNESHYPSHIVSHNSTDIFPVGWCESNSYSLVPPRFYQIPAKPEAGGMDCDEAKDASPPVQRSSWCPIIYFNHKCFSGPFLSKGKLAQLPKAVGPGPVTLVVHEVVAKLISVAYISSRVLRVLQVEGSPQRGAHLEVFKAKYKGNTHSASVAVVTSADQVPAFCKAVCNKLQVCPYLFGPTPIAENSCPEKCHTLSKTRFNHMWVTNKKKQGRPKGCISNIVHSQYRRKRGGRKRLYTHPKLLHKSNYLSKNAGDEVVDPEHKPLITKEDLASLLLLAGGANGSETGNDSDANVNAALVNSSISSASGIKRKYKKRVIPHSDIKTRGAQLPKYSKHWLRQGGWKRQDLVKRNPTCRNSENSLTPTEDPSVLKTNRVDKNAPKLPKYPHTITLDSNPIQWSEKDVFWYLKRTDNCAHLAAKCKDELIDGPAFMMLNLPTMIEHLSLKLEDALKLCEHVEKVRLALHIQYDSKREL